MIPLLRALSLLAALLAAPQVHAELRGHGGPVRALAVAPGGRLAASGSFDGSAILWSLGASRALQVLRFHDSAVNAVLFLDDQRLATGGEDGRIALWRVGDEAPEAVMTGHDGPIAALALSPDGRALASASWDRTARLWSLETRASRALAEHRDNVNAVAFTPDGGTVASAGYDATLRLTPLGGGAPLVVTLPAALNAVAIAPDGEIIVAGADGRLRFLAPDGGLRAEIELDAPPTTSLSLSRDGARIAAGGLRGAVVLIDRPQRRAIARLVGPGLPVWSLAFAPSGATLHSGGADRVVREWDARTGAPAQPPLADASPSATADADERGARVFRACVACHATGPGDDNRAGPSLHGVFGRRIGALPGYNFSSALRAMDIVWSAATIARLFEMGPQAYTPGTKMPEQMISDPEDRAALVEWLARATRPR
jgi:cytochrome c